MQDDQKAPWPEGAPNTGMNLYRPGEVTVLARSLDPDDIDPDEDRQNRMKAKLPGALNAFFQSLGQPLREGWNESRKEQDPLILDWHSQSEDGRRSPPLIYENVTLNWIAETDNDTHNPRDLARGMRDVARAVAVINDPRSGATAKQELARLGFEVVAATPNWLAMPFHW